MTHTGELNKIGKALFGEQYLGTFPQDKLPHQMYNKAGSNFAIANVDTALDSMGNPMSGTHWVALAGIPNSSKVMIFDSFGRASKKLLPIISSSGKIIDTEYDAEQKIVQDSCGQFSMAWLDFFRKYGHAAAKYI